VLAALAPTGMSVSYPEERLDEHAYVLYPVQSETNLIRRMRDIPCLIGASRPLHMAMPWRMGTPGIVTGVGR
jgi:hypothetical protein